MNQKFAHIAYVLLLIWMTAVGLTYESLSGGVAAPRESGPFYCRELMSSGGDDSAMVFAFALFAFPLLLRLLRYRRRIAVYEVAVFWICIGTTCFSLFLATLDCASIFYTAFLVPDTMLATAILAMPTTLLLITRLRAIQRRDRPI